jgi:hypothetical protein
MPRRLSYAITKIQRTSSSGPSDRIQISYDVDRSTHQRPLVVVKHRDVIRDRPKTGSNLTVAVSDPTHSPLIGAVNVRAFTCYPPPSSRLTEDSSVLSRSDEYARADRSAGVRLQAACLKVPPTVCLPRIEHHGVLFIVCRLGSARPPPRWCHRRTSLGKFAEDGLTRRQRKAESTIFETQFGEDASVGLAGSSYENGPY